MAAKALPLGITNKAPEIPWRMIKGMREVIARGSFGLEIEVVWNTASVQIPELATAERALLGGNG